MNTKKWRMFLFLLLIMAHLMGCAGTHNAETSGKRNHAKETDHTSEAAAPSAEMANASFVNFSLSCPVSNPLDLDIQDEQLIVADRMADSVHVLRFNLEGQLQSKTVLDIPAASQAGEVSGIQNLSYQEYGIWGIFYIYESAAGGDQPQETEKTEFLTLYSAEGTIVLQIALPKELVVQDLCAVDDGCLLAAAHEILHFSLEGIQDWRIDSDLFWRSLLTDSDQNLYGSTLYDEGSVYTVDAGGHTVGSPFISACGSVDLFCIYENMLYGCDETALYQYDLTTGQIVSTTALSRLGIAAILDAVPMNNGLAIIYGSTLGGKSLGFLSNCPETAENEHALQIGTIAGQNLGLLRSVIELFQLRNPSCRVDILEYAGTAEFAAAILTGTAPDLICLQNLPAEKYARNGLLYNLYDDCVDPSALVPAYRQFELNHGLYAVTPDFTLGVLFGNPAVMSAPVQSFSQIQALAADAPEHVVYPEFPDVMMGFSLDGFVDFENGTCNFDSQEFVALLELCKTDNTAGWDDIRPAVVPEEITSLDQYAAVHEYGMIELGFPQGTAVSRPVSELVGIYIGAGQKDSAKEFIQFILSEEVQTAVIQNGDAFPVLNTALQEMIAQSNQSADIIDHFQALLNNVHSADLSATELFQIVRSELDLFLNDIQSAETTAKNIQFRAAIYLAE